MTGNRWHPLSQRGPGYPGYRAATCNGCGLCCLTVPCAVSMQFGLWKEGRCRALRFAAGRYWCDAIVNPRRVSVRLAKHSQVARTDAIGAGNGCDHRAARSVEEALQLLAMRNLGDDLFDLDVPTYPRLCTVHRDDGTRWVVYVASEGATPTIQQCVNGMPYGPETEVAAA